MIGISARDFHRIYGELEMKQGGLFTLLHKLDEISFLLYTNKEAWYMLQNVHFIT